MAGACVFCEIAAGRAPASRVWEDERYVAFLDIYPMRPGHVLVVPRDHAERLADMPADRAAGLLAIGRAAGVALRRSPLACDDVNVLVNDGAAANQTVPHVHLHVVPRRRGDLPRVLARLLRRPLEPWLGGVPRRVLDANAALLRAAWPDE